MIMMMPKKCMIGSCYILAWFYVDYFSFSPQLQSIG